MNKEQSESVTEIANALIKKDEEIASLHSQLASKDKEIEMLLRPMGVWDVMKELEDRLASTEIRVREECAKVADNNTKPTSLPEDRMAFINSDERRGIKIGWDKASRALATAIRQQNREVK